MMAPPLLCRNCRGIIAIVWVFFLCPITIYCIVFSGVAPVGVAVGVIVVLLAQCQILYLLRRSSLRGTAREDDA